MKRLLFTLMLAMAGLTVTAQTHRLNYWFDGDNASHTTLTSATGAWNAEVDVAQLRVGFHTLQLQVTNTAGHLDPPRSFLFYRSLQSESTSPAQVEYWFDGDYSVHGINTGTGQQLLDVATLRDGFHTLYLRIDKGTSTQQHSYLFYKKPIVDTSMQGYRYWFDGDYATMVEGQATGNVLVDVSALRDGFHTLYLSMTKGSEGELRSSLFYKVPVAQAADSVVTWWFDGMDSAMTTQPIGDGLVMLDVAHLTDTMHTIYLVVGRGRTAQVQSYEFQKVPVVYTVTLAVDDSTRGSVSGAGDYPRNSTVSISATAEYGYHFSMWSDGDTNALRSIMLTQDTALTAYFVPDTFSFDIAVGDSAMGNVIVSGDGSYLSNDTATAVPSYGYHFTGWSDGDTTNPRLVTLTQDTVLTALFAPNIYTVTLMSDTPEWGSVVGAGEYPYLTTVPLEAVAVYGYQFKQWNDGNTQNPRQLVVRGDTTLTATFELLRYNLTVVSNDPSRGFTQGGGTFTVMDTATALAITLAGNSFLGWADGDMTNPRQLQLSSDTTLTAIFQALDSIPETIIFHDTTVVTDTVTLTQVVNVYDTIVLVDTLTEYVNVHDTTVLVDTVIVNNYIHDTGTVVIIDTLLVDNYIYDTVTLTEYVYDTTIIVDTLTEYVPVHDTTVVTDTVTLTQVVNVYDTIVLVDTLTEYVNVHDTTVLVDTVIVNNYIHDTGTVVIIDTLLVDNYIYDTVTLTEYVPVHDTTYIDVPYAVHDTTVVTMTDTVTLIQTDTVTLTEYVPVHDTTVVTLTDTVTLVQMDTVTLTEYVSVHDTAYIDVPYAVHDTTVVTLTDTVALIQTDTVTLTEYVSVHDTAYIDVPYAVHDTTVVTLTDTVTLIQTDTVTLTEYVPVHDTTYIDVPVHDTTIVTLTDTITNTEYVYDTVTNTVYDTVTNTIYDTVTNTVYDTVDNFIYDTTIVTDTLWLTLYDTVWMTDTVYIHDTVYVPENGIDGVATTNIRLYQRDGQIVVEDADGGVLPEVVVYDAVGRKMETGFAGGAPAYQFEVPASGVYLVKIGDRPARRIVVIR